MGAKQWANCWYPTQPPSPTPTCLCSVLIYLLHWRCQIIQQIIKETNDKTSKKIILNLNSFIKWQRITPERYCWWGHLCTLGKLNLGIGTTVLEPISSKHQLIHTCFSQNPLDSSSPQQKTVWMPTLWSLFLNSVYNKWPIPWKFLKLCQWYNSWIRLACKKNLNGIFQGFKYLRIYLNNTCNPSLTV